MVLPPCREAGACLPGEEGTNGERERTHTGTCTCAHVVSASNWQTDPGGRSEAPATQRELGPLRGRFMIDRSLSGSWGGICQNSKELILAPSRRHGSLFFSNCCPWFAAPTCFSACWADSAGNEQLPAGRPRWSAYVTVHVPASGRGFATVPKLMFFLNELRRTFCVVRQNKQQNINARF